MCARMRTRTTNVPVQVLLERWDEAMKSLPESERRCMADVRAAGMSLAEFGALAACVGLHTQERFADRSSLREFKEAIWEALGCGVGCGNVAADGSHRHTPYGGRGGTHVVVSFNRKALNQTGEGHFSPLGGYSRRHSAVLVMVRAPYSAMRSYRLCCALSAGCGTVQISALLGAVRDFVGGDAASGLNHWASARVRCTNPYLNQLMVLTRASSYLVLKAMDIPRESDRCPLGAIVVPEERQASMRLRPPVAQAHSHSHASPCEGRHS